MKSAARLKPLVTRTLDDRRWALVLARDPRADGKFFYSVKTTGVYCRPSCASRPAKPENVQFHASSAAAEGAGFRPCKRCKPDQLPQVVQHAALVARMCHHIENAAAVPALAELARLAGMSVYHFHRLFKATTGLTPRAYAAAHRAQRVRRELGQGGEITQAIFDAGFNTSGRFYAQSNALLGMTPSAYRKGGANTQIRFAIGECSLGSILVASTACGVCAILMGDDPDMLACDLQQRFPRAEFVGGDKAFERVVAKVVGFVEAPAKGLDLPLDVRGTAFQQRVWQALQKIPVGTTLSYTQIAKRIGAPKAVRAVASACAANALAVAIPCHRVVRIDGGLSGYRWGVARKRELLKRESL